MSLRSIKYTGMLLGAVALAGCSTTKFAKNDDGKMPKIKIGSPNSNTISTPGSPEFATAESVKHPEKVHLAYARWQEQQRQPALAREAYNKALDHDPKSVDALLGLARLDQLAARPADAELHLTKAQQLQPHSALVNAAWGEYFAAQQSWPRAIERYRQAIKLAPDEPLYKHQLAVALVKSGAVNEGFSEFVSVVGQPEAYYNVGVLLYQQGRLVEAEQHIQRAVLLKPDLTPASKMVARIQRERGLKADTALAAATPSPEAGMVAQTPAAAPAAAPPAPPRTGSDVTPVGWTTTQPTPPQPAAVTATTPQQLEQWRNQQGR